MASSSAEQCDDGNTISGDGCSSICTIERAGAAPGQPGPVSSLVIPILYRDMRYAGSSAPWRQDTDFRQSSQVWSLGLVSSSLGPTASPWASNGPSGNALTGATNFPLVVSRQRLRRRGEQPLREGCLARRFAQPDDTHPRPTGGRVERLSVQQPEVLPARRARLERGRDPADRHGLRWHHGAQLLVHERAPLPVHVPRERPGRDLRLHGRRRRVRLHQRPPPHLPRWGSLCRERKRHASTRPPPPWARPTAGCTPSTCSRQASHLRASTYKLTLGGFQHTVSQCATTCGDSIVAGNGCATSAVGMNVGGYGG